MLQLLGVQLPFGPAMPVRECIQTGRASLVQITGEDFGFDPQRWHEYLRETGAGGYRWSNKHLGMPKRIVQTVQDRTWVEAVQELQEAA